MKEKQDQHLSSKDHKSLVLWAAECAERVLPCFEVLYPQDTRPRKALEAARLWARGEMTCTQARKAAFAAHAAARDADSAAARAASRAAGHAAATAHVVGHARHAADYAARAATLNANGAIVDATSLNTDIAAGVEREWQRHRLPVHLRSVVLRSGSVADANP